MLQTVLYVVGPFLLYAGAGIGCALLAVRGAQRLSCGLRAARVSLEDQERAQDALRLVQDLYYDALASSLLADQLGQDRMGQLNDLTIIDPHPHSPEEPRWQPRRTRST